MTIPLFYLSIAVLLSSCKSENKTPLLQEKLNAAVKTSAYSTTENAPQDKSESLGGGYKNFKWGDSLEAVRSSIGYLREYSGYPMADVAEVYRFDLEGERNLYFEFHQGLLIKVMYDMDQGEYVLGGENETLRELVKRYGQYLKKNQYRHSTYGYPLIDFIWNDGETSIVYSQVLNLKEQNNYDDFITHTVTYTSIKGCKAKDAELRRLNEEARRKEQEIEMNNEQNVYKNL